MKKFMTLAVASILSMSAFAQDVYKQISKIKDYNEAYNLLKSNLSNMSAEQKAKCYSRSIQFTFLYEYKCTTIYGGYSTRSDCFS